MGRITGGTNQSSAAKVEMLSINIRKINADDIDACTFILRSLPDWFGIEESILEYERNLASLDGYVTEVNATIVGFVGLKRYGEYAIEIDIIGIKPEFHRKGIGKQLLDYIELYATNPSTKFLHTKTLAPSHPDPNYAETRAFWEANGYIPMDVHNLWGAENPCQVMVKSL